MTNEEHIEQLKKLRSFHNGSYGRSINKAIEALEQEPCEDVVNRQTVKEQMIKYGFHAPDMTVTEFVEDLPPVRQYEPKYCDRNICLKNEYNGMGCDECEVTKSQEPKTGHWISHREHCENLGVMPSGLGAYEWCSNCDCGIDVREWHRNNYNYCPNCGARMESEDKR